MKLKIRQSGHWSLAEDRLMNSSLLQFCRQNDRIFEGVGCFGGYSTKINLNWRMEWLRFFSNLYIVCVFSVFNLE